MNEVCFYERISNEIGVVNLVGMVKHVNEFEDLQTPFKTGNRAVLTQNAQVDFSVALCSPQNLVQRVGEIAEQVVLYLHFHAKDSIQEL